MASSGAVMAFSGAVIHLLEDVSERVSSTQLRTAAASSGKRLEGYERAKAAEAMNDPQITQMTQMTEPRPPAFWLRNLCHLCNLWIILF